MKAYIKATWEWINYEPASTQSLEIPQKDMYMYTTDSKGLLWDAAYRALLACSQTIYFLFKSSAGQNNKQKPWGIYSPPAQGGRGEGSYFRKKRKEK